MATLTELTRPIVRRIGWLIVRIDAEGVAIRGYRRRRWYFISWARIAWFAAFLTPPLLLTAEERKGSEELARITGAKQWTKLKRSA